MSAINTELGNVQYIYLRNTECNNGAGADATGIFTWTLPSTPARESPFMYIQVVQCMIHYSGTGTQGNNEPQFLTYENMYADNFFSSDKSTVLASILCRDAAAGQYIPQVDAPIIRVPSNLTQITFSIRNQINNEVDLTGLTGSCSILLKLIKPQHDKVQNNVLKSYVQSEIGNPPFNRL